MGPWVHRVEYNSGAFEEMELMQTELIDIADKEAVRAAADAGLLPSAPKTRS